MRYRHSDGSTVHLAYCTNMHPAEDLDGIVDQLDRYAGPTRQQLGWPMLGVGLWIPASTAHILATDESALALLREALERNRLECVTFNAFPYQAFQAEVVKIDVMLPNWTSAERLQFTIDMARVLIGLLPDDVTEGTIATLPIGWREPDPREAGRPNLLLLVDELIRLRDASGKSIRLAVEPEPGCIIESTPQAVAELADLAPDWIGLCYDACHAAVQFEEPAMTIATLDRSNLVMYKAGVTSALRAHHQTSADWLKEFVEPRFFHQVRERHEDGTVIGVDDLDSALAGELPREGEWRIHFHVPLHDESERTTQAELIASLAALVGGPHPYTQHLEVETYTWSVLPEHQRPVDDAGFISGIAAEMQWTHDQLLTHGLKPIE